MSRSKQSPRQLSRYPRLMGCVSAAVIAFFMWALGEAPLAHEHKRTHNRLTKAAYDTLQDFNLILAEEAARVGDVDIREQLAQGVIDEDECIDDDGTGSGRSWNFYPNWNSHFFEPQTPAGPVGQITVAFDPFKCTGTNGGFQQVSARARAGQLWDLAKEDYAAGRYRSAYRILGRILHLLQDMTSPAHVHNDPHGKISPFTDWAGCASQDIDDFEIWGWCPENILSGDNIPSGEHDHIRDYVSDQGVRTARLNAALLKLFNSAPQGIPGSLDVVQLGTDPNMASAFIRRLSKRVYDFTTFHVKLRDLSNSTDVQEDSELRRMLLGSTSD